MVLDKRKSEEKLKMCGQIHEDDGVNPRDFFKPKKSHDKQNHKARQLCSQVADSLNLVLSGECGDEVLQGLQVVAVDPAPTSSRLMVSVNVDNPGQDVTAQQILDLLAKQAGTLRSAVAADITRKHAPELVFQIVGFTSEEEEQP